jgi:hypothetical protein
MDDRSLMRLSWLMIGLIAWPVSVLAESIDIESMIPQYPRSELVQSVEGKEIAKHEIMLGALKKTAGFVQADRSEFVVGRRISSTWLVPDEERTDVVASFFRSRLEPLGKVLFECKGYECGSSNYWANNVFSRAILYGPEQYQRYFVTKIERDATYYVATYIALRGTRKLYAHTDIIVTDKQAQGGALILATLVAKGRVVIDTLTGTQIVDDVAEAMTLDPALRIGVVGHARKLRGESVAQAVARSEQNARVVVSQVIAQGINLSRIEAYGVGPLSPMDREIVDRLELVLISD